MADFKKAYCPHLPLLGRGPEDPPGDVGHPREVREDEARRQPDPGGGEGRAPVPAEGCLHLPLDDFIDVHQQLNLRFAFIVFSH